MNAIYHDKREVLPGCVRSMPGPRVELNKNSHGSTVRHLIRPAEATTFEPSLRNQMDRMGHLSPC